MANAWFSLGLLGGKYTFGSEIPSVLHKSDADATKPAEKYREIDYPKPDGKLTFDLLTNLSRSGTNHSHNQPVHLKIKPGMESKPKNLSLKVFNGPEARFCPAGVYEFVDEEL